MIGSFLKGNFFNSELPGPRSRGKTPVSENMRAAFYCTRGTAFPMCMWALIVVNVGVIFVVHFLVSTQNLELVQIAWPNREVLTLSCGTRCPFFWPVSFWTSCLLGSLCAIYVSSVCWSLFSLDVFVCLLPFMPRVALLGRRLSQSRRVTQFDSRRLPLPEERQAKKSYLEVYSRSALDLG